jgi:hypothetical protein
MLLTAYRAGAFRGRIGEDEDDPGFEEVDEQEFVMRLARSPGPEVRKFLLDRLAAATDEVRRAFFLDALARHDGLPESEYISEHLDENTPAALRSSVQVHVVAERPVDALLALLEHAEKPDAWGLGDVRDERIADHLRRLRKRRSLGKVIFATDELARLGDPDAVREVRAVRAAANYRWGDALTERAMSEGPAPTPTDVEDWIDLLESSCCQSALSGNRMEMLFHWPVGPHGTAAATARTVAQWWWDTWGHELVRSRIEERFVPAARPERK